MVSEEVKHRALRRAPCAGVMNGGRTVTRDTCLYAEDYAFRLAREYTNGTQQAAIVVSGEDEA